MPKKKDKSTIVCKNKACGQTYSKIGITPVKTWNLVSPMPDKQGRMTITIMGTFTCPHCERRNISVVSKFKDVEEGEQKKSKQEKLIELLESGERVLLAEIALEFGFSDITIVKAVEALIRQERILGRIEDGMFIRN